MRKAIGIDLGTTNTVVAVLLEGRPQVLEDDKGYRVLPSVVCIDEFGAEVVGHAARNRILTDPDRTVYAIKRLMGRRFDTEQVADAVRRVGYDIEEAPDGTCFVVAAGARLTPVEISAMILKTAREMAERALGEPVEEAVITVPAYFNHQQRTATLEAAQLAGLTCDRLVNEPTAAALAYGLRRDVERTLVIYDLGGGTFDVSVLHLAGGVYEILSTRGDTFLGGEDFDYRLVDYLADHFQTQTGHDLRQERIALQRLKDAAERAKCELSFTDKTTVLVPRLAADANLELAITRLTLESLVEDLVERSVEVTRTAIGEAGLQVSDIDDVILVGGQTRMPRVREAISGLFGKEPSRGVHPEEVVAIGAAVHASSITQMEGAPHHVLIDVTPFDLGIDVAGGLFQTVISRNTHVPTSDTRTFATTRDDQENVRITVRQGDSRFADENEFLGEFTMEGLTAAPRMETKVEVTFRIDSNGMLHVAAVEPGTGEARRITVRNYAEVAKSKGGVTADIESDGKESRIGANGADDAPAAVGKGDGKAKKGFLAGLLGRRKKAAAKPAAAAEVAAAAAAVAAQGESVPPGVAADDTEPSAAGALLESDGATISATTEGLINLPEVAPLEVIDDDLLEELEGELIEPDELEPDLRPRGDESATIGMAGGSLDSWRTDESDFALPGFDDDEEEDAVPIGFAGGGGYDRANDDVFALPDDDENTSPDGAAPLGAVDADDDLLGLGDDAFGDLGDLGDDAFANLDQDAFANLGDDLDDDIFALPQDSIPVVPKNTGIDEPGTDRVPPVAEQVDEANTSDLFDFTTLAPANELADTGDLPALSKPSNPSVGQTSSSAEDNDVEPEPLFLPPPDLASVADETIGEDLFGLPEPAVRPTPRAAPEPAAADPDEDDRLFSLPAGLTEAAASRMSNAASGADKARSDDGGDGRKQSSASAADTAARPKRKKRRRRKPARLKLAYRHVDAMVTEYRENLRRGGCFVKTTKPLPVGRECVIEVRAPGMEQSLSLAGVVTWSSVGLSTLPAGQDPGMGIEYRLDDDRRVEVEQILANLGR